MIHTTHYCATVVRSRALGQNTYRFMCVVAPPQNTVPKGHIRVSTSPSRVAQKHPNPPPTPPPPPSFPITILGHPSPHKAAPHPPLLTGVYFISRRHPPKERKQNGSGGSGQSPQWGCAAGTGKHRDANTASPALYIHT